jgi:hypothetical protein
MVNEASKPAAVLQELGNNADVRPSLKVWQTECETDGASSRLHLFPNFVTSWKPLRMSNRAGFELSSVGP